MKKENKNKIQPRQQVVIQILWSILQNEKLTDMERRWGRQQEAGVVQEARSVCCNSNKHKNLCNVKIF